MSVLAAEVPHPPLARRPIAVVRQPVVAAFRHSDRLDAVLLGPQSRLFTVERVRVHQEESRPTHHHVGRAQASHRRARRQNQVVWNYLNALTTAKPVGRRPSATREQLQERIAAESDAVKRVKLIQPRLELEDPLVAEQG